MKRTTTFIGAALITVAAINYALVAARRGAPPALGTSKEAPYVAGSGTSKEAPYGGDIVAAGPGRVEALSEEVRVSAQVGGRLQAVLVEENDRVFFVQVLATIENA